MHSCGQLKLKRASLFSCRFWAHRTWCIPRVENWRIKHLCNMQLAVISATAQCNYVSTLPVTGAHGKDDGIGSFSRAQRADGDGQVARPSGEIELNFLAGVTQFRSVWTRVCLRPTVVLVLLSFPLAAGGRLHELLVWTLQFTHGSVNNSVVPWWDGYTVVPAAARYKME